MKKNIMPIMLTRVSLLQGMFLTFLFCMPNVNAQEKKEELPSMGIKTNLLYDATITVNFGVEFRIGQRISLDLSGDWNPWTFSNRRKWKHALAQPEIRLWARETFSGHFFGLHTHYAYYNVGNLPNGIFSGHMADHRYEGWLSGAGGSYGYRLNFSRNWGLEAIIGVGYAYLDYDKYKCGACGEKLGSDTKNYWGPTKAGITLIYSFGKSHKSAPVTPIGFPPIIGEVESEPFKEIYEPQFMISYLVPEVEVVKQRREAGRAYLDFVVGQAVINPTYRSNASELGKIYKLIEDVKGEHDATITGVSIVGYASPEGSCNSNLILSEKRAYALKAHIQERFNLSNDLFTVIGKGEDWGMLDTLINSSSMANKYAALEIIRSTDGFDRKERRLMALAGGSPYRLMKTDLFPQLRRTEYELIYTVLPFTVEQGKRVFHTNPGNLSLNEIFLIANTYEQGSDAFNEIFETAVRLFPADDTANLNATASALARKDVISAARYLSKVKDRTPEYWNNAGILAFMEGHIAKAIECFTYAGKQSAGNIGELDKYNRSKTE